MFGYQKYIKNIIGGNIMSVKIPCMKEAAKLAFKTLRYDVKQETEAELQQISGMLKQEQLVMDNICKAYSEFLKLEMQHPSEMKDFVNAIHTIQGILGMRIVRRNYSDYWLIHK
jgi:hypothetical protein